ncbi:hypothetical protein SRO_7315 [Streptomyces rochei]|nr:hypothetical protein SRO_7315 [Streptomyces rochei]
MAFPGMVAPVQVEVTRPDEKTGGFVLFADCGDQRFHRRAIRLTALPLSTAMADTRPCPRGDRKPPLTRLYVARARQWPIVAPIGDPNFVLIGVTP